MGIGRYSLYTRWATVLTFMAQKSLFALSTVPLITAVRDERMSQ